MHHLRRVTALATLTVLTALIGCGEEATEPAPAPDAPAPTTTPAGDQVGTATEDMGGTVD